MNKQNIIEEIYTGWKNYIFPNKKVEELAKKRILICVDCVKLTSKKTCNVCGCFMPAKVRNPQSRCPISRW